MEREKVKREKERERERESQRREREKLKGFRTRRQKLLNHLNMMHRIGTGE